MCFCSLDCATHSFAVYCISDEDKEAEEAQCSEAKETAVECKRRAEEECREALVVKKKTTSEVKGMVKRKGKALAGPSKVKIKCFDNNENGEDEVEEIRGSKRKGPVMCGMHDGGI
ncbi:hypothetical protein BU17DRAFT_70739 [Hysterangium stoloniferum]|nr:hypothetical protein BU17DRAFT_70739 [Hysterangium stoloniferum]